MGNAGDEHRAELFARAEYLIDELGAVAASSPKYSDLGDLADGDIMAMAFIVMMEAAKSAREDLKSIMDGVKAINREKAGWRKVATALKKNDVECAKEAVKTKLDSLSELSEQESLRLQMSMDRLSKLMSTLSNLLKKASDTADGIVANIK